MCIRDRLGAVWDGASVDVVAVWAKAVPWMPASAVAVRIMPRKLNMLKSPQNHIAPPRACLSFC